ncbi:MAG: phosphopantothenate/pantothenate synthetase, partial [Euryarchaeota archaeon]|nr:phosphopantothenate/pantothenate synthetase [Euryarchaeota archaeon]
MVSKEHPRYESLALRNKLVDGYEKGITSAHGLIAHGRGEAFDYILGEQTSENALKATNVACAYLLTARYPILSVNGNTAALVPEEIAEFCALTGIPVEVNLFHRSEERIKRITDYLHAYGVANVLSGFEIITLDHIASNRAKVDTQGIFKADVVFAPLEDGDRAQALTKLGKVVLTVDLNPLSRTAVTSTITIVDEVTRAMKNMISFAKHFDGERDKERLDTLKASFDNFQNLKASYV